MLRISNLVPVSEHFFDPNKQLVRGDVTFNEVGDDISIHWVKNLQRTDQQHVVRVPRIAAHPHMCPVQALRLVLAKDPSLPQLPLIWHPSGPITEKKLQERLTKLNNAMNLTNKGSTFH